MSARATACLLAVVLFLPDVSKAQSVGYSPTFTVDTRQIGLSSIVVSGPASVSVGSEAAYTATLTLAGGQTRDVSQECEWRWTGGAKVDNWWELPELSGSVLTPKTPSSTPLKLTASFQGNTGRVTSAPFNVTVLESNGMAVGIRFKAPSTSRPQYLGFSGGQHGWRVVAEAYGQAALNPSTTYQWRLNGVLVGSAKTFDGEILGQAGTRQLELVATDPLARVGRAYASLVCEHPPGAGEPITSVPAQDPGDADVLDGAGNLFSFDPTKKGNGLIIITHGLNGSGDDQWIKDMVGAIRARFQALGRQLPNIVVFDWRLKSNPPHVSGWNEKRDALRESASNFLKDYAVLRTDMAFNMLVDLLIIRPIGQEIGLELSDWVRTEIRNGNIDTSAPLHLIGHSAGGFVVGECGYRQRAIFGNVRVTMLDTPFPYFDHIWRFPNPGKLDRVVSSTFGRLEFPGTYLSAIDTSYRTYRLVGLPLFPTFGEHSESHEWYSSTIPNAAAGSDGFGLSPVLGGAAQGASLMSLSATAGSFEITSQSESGVETTVGLSGFSTFGNVSAVANGYTLTEGAGENSGIFLPAYRFPAGTRALRVSFRFTSPGDGDFLSVFFGDAQSLLTGKDMTLTREELTTVDIPVEHLNATTDTLPLRLVSRGQANAVLRLQDIQAVVVEDLDQDGLTNAQEQVLGTSGGLSDTDADDVTDPLEVNVYGTDPLNWDTDGDGASDGEEVAADTDPKNPGSRLAVVSTSLQNRNFRLDWASRATRKYRVHRSTSPTFDTFEVLSFDLQGNVGTSGYTDSSVPLGSSKFFYRVQLEPAP